MDDLHDLTGRIIGAAMKVHRALGPGFLESVYQNALLHELRKAGLRAEEKQEIKVYYDGIVVGQFKSDVLVNSVVIVELKGIDRLAKCHEVQLVNYLTATNLDVGLVDQFRRRKPGIQAQASTSTAASDTAREPDMSPK